MINIYLQNQYEREQSNLTNNLINNNKTIEKKNC